MILLAMSLDLAYQVRGSDAQRVVGHRDSALGRPGPCGLGCQAHVTKNWQEDKRDQMSISHGGVLYGLGARSAKPLDYRTLPLVQTAVGARCPVPR